MVTYSSEFYEDMKEGSRRTARVVVPLVMSMLEPRSVIDIGSGVGTWLAVFIEHGVEDVWGVDGDYVDRSWLEIPKERFIPSDLKSPFRMDRHFDLVMSLEVAEHLPAECAKTYVDTLTGLGPIVLFSAAIPFQGGTEHLNEQWPEYWAAYFEAKGYVPIDCLRRRIWRKHDVEWWYAQNLLVFAAREELGRFPSLEREYELMGTAQLSLVHPQKYLYCIEWGESLLESMDTSSAIDADDRGS